MSTTDKKPFSFSAAAKAWKRSAPAWEISVRDHFALVALREAMRDPLLYADEKRTASWAYTVAEAMCDQRDKRNQEGACIAPEPAVSDPELHHTHTHGAAPSSSSMPRACWNGPRRGADGAIRGLEPDLGVRDSSGSGSASSIWSLEQRRAVELVLQAEEVVGIDAACAVMKQKAPLFNWTQRAPVKLPATKPHLQDDVFVRGHCDGWNVCLDRVRKSLAEAGIEVETQA